MVCKLNILWQFRSKSTDLKLAIEISYTCLDVTYSYVGNSPGPIFRISDEDFVAPMESAIT